MWGRLQPNVVYFDCTKYFSEQRIRLAWGSSSGLNNRPTPDLAAVAQEGGETNLGLVDPNEGLGEIEGGWAPF